MIQGLLKEVRRINKSQKPQKTGEKRPIGLIKNKRIPYVVDRGGKKVKEN